MLKVVKKLLDLCMYEFQTVTNPAFTWYFYFERWVSILSRSKKIRYLESTLLYEDILNPITLVIYIKEVNKILSFYDGRGQLNVLDIGANIGIWGLTVAKLHPNSKIFSFEPNQKPFILLEKNSENFDNWIVENRGIGSQNIEQQLYFVPGKSGQGSLNKEKANANLLSSVPVAETVVKLSCFDKAFLKVRGMPNHFEIVKIDVEGNESDTIKGITAITWDIMFVEVDIMEGLIKSQKEIINQVTEAWPDAVLLYTAANDTTADMIFKRDKHLIS